MGVEEDDALLAVQQTDGKSEVLIGTRQGQSIRFPEEDVRSMGRTAYGVRGIALKDDDEVVAMEVVRPGGTVLTVTANGYGKRTALEEYRLQSRGGSGIINIQTSDRNGVVVGIAYVSDEHELMLITQQGQTLRMGAKDVRVIGRATQGVRLIGVAEGDQVVSIVRLEDQGDANGGDGNGNGGGEGEPATDAGSDADATPDVTPEPSADAGVTTSSRTTFAVPASRRAGIDDDVGALSGTLSTTIRLLPALSTIGKITKRSSGERVDTPPEWLVETSERGARAGPRIDELERALVRRLDHRDEVQAAVAHGVIRGCSSGRRRPSLRRLRRSACATSSSASRRPSSNTETRHVLQSLPGRRAA